MSLHYVPEILGGILLSRLGEVHQYRFPRTPCGQLVAARQVVAVSHVQAVVHKLPLCGHCYPSHHNPGGRHAH